AVPVGNDERVPGVEAAQVAPEKSALIRRRSLPSDPPPTSGRHRMAKSFGSTPSSAWRLMKRRTPRLNRDVVRAPLARPPMLRPMKLSAASLMNFGALFFHKSPAIMSAPNRPS